MKRNGLLKKLCAGTLAVLMMMGCLSGISAPANARTVVFGGLGVKDTDPATVNNWKTFYDKLDTSYAGGVWTDKSVFESADAYFAATDEAEKFDMQLENPRDFFISLSAIASTKTIVGYSTLPIDTMFVLDVSGSMDSSSRDSRMVQAANKAIGDLLALNKYNRVGVVLYSDSATLLMPLDRYTTTSTTTVDNTTIPSYIYLNNSDDVVVSNGVRNSNNRRPNGSREVVGGTYIQRGIYAAMEELTDPNLDTVITEGFQVGTTRTPIMVLMSDGAPTYATNSYTSIGSYNMGNGSAQSTTGDMAFVTQLTASWAKEKIGEKYGNEVEPLFYTLGLGVGSDPYAVSVMNPLGTGTSNTANDYWTEYNALAEGESLNLRNHSYRYNGRTYYRQVTKLNDGVDNNNDTLPLSQGYVDEYFAASNSNDLSTAFQKIVDTIILQTMYYPTLVEGGDVDHSGYLEFRDYIGPNMEVKQVEGVQAGENLYTGEKFAQLVATGMGTEQNPTEAGNELVRSLITRLKLGQISDPAAVQTTRDLLRKAWQAGQLAYNVDYDGNVTWSNWVGWYADENEKYLGFWDGDGIDADMAGKAAFAIKSYLVLGDVGDGHRDTDMLYASIQVRSHLDANGNVIEDVVYGRLPASLIPMVEYNVELNSNDPSTATEITLSRTGAAAPSRLIYEVGLRKEIDLLNMEGTATDGLKTDANGNYIFYTNQWDTAGLEAGNHPNKLHNAYVNFFPSEENERYYYHEDMPVYIMGDNGYVRYSGSKPAAGDGNTYYRAYVIYSASSNGGRATYSVEYQPIPASALSADSVQRLENTNQWVIKKGTLHLFEARDAVAKTGNTTATLPYSEYPIVHSEADNGYHLDGILGNNGLLTINPPEGFKLTKLIDDTLVDNGQTYTFDITLVSGSHDNAVIYLVTETDGVRSAWQKLPLADTYTVELAAGDSLWLVGLPEGNQYTITEVVDGDFEVSSITVDGAAADEAVVTARKNHIADVQFTNSAVFTGDLKISKNVVSTYAPHMTSAYAFSFDGILSGAEPNTAYEAVIVAADGFEVPQNSSILTDANGYAEFDVDLCHGEALLIKNLPEGAAVTATERQLPGFTSNFANDTASADVVVGDTTAISFINTYAAEPVSPVAVDVYAHKILEGRDWADGDSFSFTVEKHVSTDVHTPIETVVVDYYDDDKTADFRSNTGEIYTEPGIYSYRVLEQPGNLAGIAYDTAICYFDIVVEDDGEGHLYIADVIGRQNVTVDHDDASNTWDVTAEFTNAYNSEGSVQVSLSVAKNVIDEAETGIDKSGFVFELYDADEYFTIGNAPRAAVTTNAEGVAAFRDTIFTQEGTYYFVLKEQTGSVSNMSYDPTVYHLTVNVTSDPATSGLVVTGTVSDVNGNVIYEDSASYDPAAAVVPTLSYSVPFENVYNPVGTQAVISGEKVLEGRPLENNEFTFELYEASLTDAGFVTGNYITSVTNAGSGFTFENLDALTYSKTGYYYYAVKEAAGNMGGVTYDEKTLYVTVQVTADKDQGALVVNSVNVTDAEGVSARLRFSNTYKAAPVAETIVAEKTMTGTRMLAADMFQFHLYETAEDYVISGQPLQTVTNAADGSVKFDLNYTQTGTYYYVVAERLPANLDANGRLNGVLYDTNTYRVQVVVRDNLGGQLVTEVSYLDGTPAFSNDYTPAPTTAVLGGTKTLDGRTQTAGEFTFDLYETDAKFVPVDNVADGSATTYDNGNGQFAFTFDRLNYTQVGGYRYIIVERNTGDSQIDYDETVFYALVSVTDNGNGQLVSQVSIGSAIDANGMISTPVSGMEFYNVFNHTPAVLALSGSKTLQDHAWEAGHVFTFELYEADSEFVVADGTAPVTAKNDPTAQGQEGVFTFPEMTFDEEGTYYYVVKETLPAGVTEEDPRDDSTGIIYDTKAHHVTVVVAEDPADPTALKATYTVDGSEGGIAFTNRYTAEGSVLATITGKKILEGRNLHTDGFSFVLKDSAGMEVETVINNGDGTSNEGSFAFHPLTFEKAGTYTYTVEEVEGSVPGVTYSDVIYTVTVEVGHKGGKLLEPVVTYKADGKAADGIVFTNTYKASASDELVLDGRKTLSGGILKDGQFTFELYTAEKNDNGTFTAGKKLEEVTNTGTAFAFDGLTYEEAGTYYYLIKEQFGSETGITYDDNEFYVTVTVEDPGDGKLAAQVLQIEEKEHVSGVGIVFTNVFTPAPISASFSGTKTLTGRTMQEGEFSFELYQTGADHVIAEGTQPIDTAVNANGAFAFDAVELDRVGAYYYVVKEVKGNASYVTYDATVYNITVNVTNNNGVLEKEVIYKVGSEVKTELAFRNTYKKPDPQPNPIDVDLYVEKILKGRGYGLDGFLFELADQNGNVIDTATSDRNGNAVLDVGTFRKSDAGRTYTYYIREVDTDLPGVSYSTRVYEVRITVFYDSARNQLFYELVKDGVVVNGGEPFVFTNVIKSGDGDDDFTENPETPYNPGEPTSPDTGDEGIGSWIMLLAVSAAGFAATLLALIVRRRRYKA